MKDIRNFDCPATGERCNESRCKRNSCIFETGSMASAIHDVGNVVVRKVGVGKSRMSKEGWLVREKLKIAQEVLRNHEKKNKIRFRSQIRIQHLANLIADPRVVVIAQKRYELQIRSQN